MLCGQNRCRRHDCPLKAVGSAHEKSQKGKNGFSAPDIALNQTVHRMVRTEILPNILKDLLLSLRQFIGQSLNQPGSIRRFDHFPVVFGGTFRFLSFLQSSQKEIKFIKGESFSGL